MPVANPAHSQSRKRRLSSPTSHLHVAQSAPAPLVSAPRTPPRPSGATTTFAPQAQSTPLALRIQSQNEVKAEKVHAARAKDTQKMDNDGYWVGPMPMDEFLEKFVPKASTTPPATTYNTEGIKREKDIYNTLIAGMNDSKVNTTFVDTSNHADRKATRGHIMKPDFCSYARCIDLGDGRTQLDKAFLAGEDKLLLDLFNDAAKHGCFEPSLNSKNSVSLGQILRYMEEMHSRQDRKFSFFLFINVEHFRIIRADRDGFIVTERTKWADPAADVTNNALNDFLHRFDNMTAEQMGFDPTVYDAPETDANIARAREALEKVIPKDMKPKGKKSKLPVRKVGVPRAEGEGGLRWFYASEPTSAARGMRSRATRGYPAWDPVEDGIVFIKDGWRSDTGSVLKEAEVIKELNDAGVQYAPKLICGGDLPGQRTVTGDYVDAVWNKGQRKTHHPRVHHRIAMNFGLPLWKFRSTQHLMHILHDAFTCHLQAVDKCRKLHRDFSAWNILWDEASGRGFLADWDLCAPMPPKGASDKDPSVNMMAQLPSGSGRPERTGTWMFMSTLSLSTNHKLHDVQDDLEALFWVAVYIVILYTPFPQGRAIHIVDAIFTEYSFVDGEPTGGSGKTSFLSNARNELYRIDLPDSPVISAWLRGYRRLIHNWVLYHFQKVEDGDRADDDAFAAFLPPTNAQAPPFDYATVDQAWVGMMENGEKKGRFKDGDRLNDKEHQLHPFEVTALYRARLEEEAEEAKLAHASAQHALAVLKAASAPLPHRSHPSHAGTSQSNTLMGSSSEPVADDTNEEEAERGAKRQRTSKATFKRTSSPQHDQCGRGSPGKGRGSMPK